MVNKYLLPIVIIVSFFITLYYSGWEMAIVYGISLSAMYLIGYWFGPDILRKFFGG